MSTTHSGFIQPVILSLFLFAFSQGIEAQQAPPVNGNPPDNSIACDLLREDATNNLTDAIESNRTALFGTGSTGLPGGFSPSDALDRFLGQALYLLYDSFGSLDRAAVAIVDMSVAGCISPESALNLAEDIQLAGGKIGFIVRNGDNVDAVVYRGLLKGAIDLEEAVFVQIKPQGASTMPTTPTTSTTPTTPTTSTTPTTP